MKFVGGSVNTFGNRNRANPNNHNTCVTASDVKPTASGVPNNTERNPRRSLTFSGSVASTGRFGIGGTSSLGLTAAGFSSVVLNVFGPRCTGLRAAAKILDVSRGPTGASGSVASLAAATGAAGFGFAALGLAAAGFAPPPPPPRAAARISSTDIPEVSIGPTGAGVSSAASAGAGSDSSAAGASDSAAPPRAADRMSSTDIDEGSTLSAGLLATGSASAVASGAGNSPAGSAGAAEPPPSI